MKKSYVALSGLLILVLAAATLAGCTTAKASADAVPAATSQKVTRYITVVGNGQVSLVPDIAEISIGAEVSAGTVAEAKADVDSRIDAILVVLKEMGIAEKDIQTSNYNIYYERDFYFEGPQSDMPEKAEGSYRVSNMLRVTVRDIEMVSEVLDAAVEAGANQMYGVSFTVSDEQIWQSEAREKAMADAKSRAEELAGLTSVELGEVLSVSEVLGSSPVYARSMMMEAGYGGGGVAPGELEFSTQIQVTFAIQ